jgi:hypothetical protein
MTPRRLEILLALYSGTYAVRTYDYSPDLASDIKYLEESGYILGGRYTVNTCRVEELLAKLCNLADHHTALKGTK